MKSKMKPFLPVLIIFILIVSFSISGKNLLNKWGIDQDLFAIGNLVLFIATFISYSLAARGLKSENPHAFVRSVYVSIMIKMVICLVAVLVYIFSTEAINKPGLFFCMGLYLVYTFVEVNILTKLAKQKTNA